MKSVLISIRPDWIQKIFDREKTVEIRKTFPKLPPPFKCFIYCTKPRYDHDDFLMTMKGPLSYYWGGGMVVGEFVCTGFTNVRWLHKIVPDEDGDGFTRIYATDCDALKKACISQCEVARYAGGKNDIFGWHISNLKVYDKPKLLSDFKRWNGTKSWSTLERLKRPPQSWCYADGGLIG